VKALALKELREHGWVLMALVLLLTAGVVGQLTVYAEDYGRFAVYRRFVIVLGPVGALVAGHRLVVREYSGKTQLFLEQLPIRRADVVFTKWLLGWAWCVAVVVLGWAFSWAWRSQSEVISGSDAAHAIVAGVLWISVFWAVCFVAGLLGRHRWLLWGLLACLGVAVERTSEVELDTVPVFHMIGPQLESARVWPEKADVVASFAIVGIGLATAWTLAVMRQGALAALFAGRTTARERIFAVCAVMVGLLAVSAISKEREKPAFTLGSVTPFQSVAGPIGVLPGRGVTAWQAQQMTHLLAADVVSFVEAMGYPRLPGVYVLSQAGLDADVVLAVPLADRDGIVFRANLADDRLDPLNVRYRILHSIVSRHTGDRALEEDRHWLLDGLAAWWTVRDDEAGRALMRKRSAAAPLSLSMESVRRWTETFERAGDCFGMGLSFTLFDTLVEELGMPRAVALARQVFVKPHRDVRDWLFETPLSKSLADAGVDWPALVARAEAARQTQGPPSRYRAGVEWVSEGGGQRRARFTLAKEPQPVGAWRALLARVGPWQNAVADTEPTRVDARGPSVMANEVFVEGTRVFLAIETDDRDLACTARVFQAWQDL
jgi:hypothetical protein